MNNHIYSTLFKTQERESDRRSKEIEQRKELHDAIGTNTDKNRMNTTEYGTFDCGSRCIIMYMYHTRYARQSV